MQVQAHEHLQEVFAGKQNIRVITITRKNSAYGYGKLDTGEINLIFAQLAACINNQKVIHELLLSRTKDSALQKDILQKYIENIEKQPITPSSHNVTIILFNEMFFCKDSALTKSEVDDIISCYQAFHKFLPNTFLHINFLYQDAYSKFYEIQLQESYKVYKEIYNKVYPFSFMNFIDYSEDDDEEDYKENKKRNDALCKEYIEKILASEIASTLLFNQTKVFFDGYEIGFYNKSSYYLEAIAEFLDETRNSLKTEFPFYVIGNFNSHCSEFLTLSKSWEHALGCKMWMDNIINFICYDIDAIENDVSYNKVKAKNLVLFASNSHYGLLASISHNPLVYTTDTTWAKSLIYADPEGAEFESLDNKAIATRTR